MIAYMIAPPAGAILSALWKRMQSDFPVTNVLARLPASKATVSFVNARATARE